MSEQCECTQDGFCSKYTREMHGRNREICRGVNIDLGTAAAFKLQWKKEVKASKPTRALQLSTNQAPGDAVVMTAAIYSLHKAYPGEYITSIYSPFPEIFEGNPFVGECGGEPLEMHYPAVKDSNTRNIHFMQAYCEFLGFALGREVPLATNKPMLYAEQKQKGDYWLICSGGKSDFTNKLWGYSHYQEVVDRAKVKFIQVGDAKHYHPKLHGAIDLVGKTSLRELITLVSGARGVVCGVTLLHHLAAAFEVPSITIVGGREPVTWEAYSTSHMLHTTGMLPCCKFGGCWKSRLKPLGDNEELDASLCEMPGEVPRCMELITPATVLNLLELLQA